MYSEKDYIDEIIPHRLAMIEIMLFALTEMRQTIEPKKMVVYIDDKPCFEGLETAFTNPAIEAGIINCRAMLEFLGLKLSRTNQTELVTRSRSNNDDLHIEDFRKDGVALEKVTPDKVRRLSLRNTDKEKGVRALARLLHISNKEIAHPTCGRSNEDDGTDVDLMILGAKGIRALTNSYFYKQLGLNPPPTLIQFRPETVLYQPKI
ncbi:hypothetical protein C8R26_1633 [Nitrosomonas oligotropha]|uniref:Uncharacterized protein n=1 Tax=Nitrosomonas oligotropha TaxID=42354 RepID=A0A2T5GZA8_9PROT|nr:hypothetical protein [Nitrosomonas oligotropha]PTQ64647.1 hypothetical protein C8R26_1633 [Nitrosomonas oligotropha]